MSRLRKLLALPFARVHCLTIASVLLAMAKQKHAYRPIDQLIEEVRAPLNEHRPANAKLAGEIAWALQIASKHVPWRADCLIRAIAARQWAKLRDLPYEFHL